MADPLPFVCPICQRQSWHPRDAEERYCAVCGFVDDPPPRRSRMPDERWERMAREAAQKMLPCDYGSSRAIHDVARLLRIAYDLGRAEMLRDG